MNTDTDEVNVKITTKISLYHGNVYRAVRHKTEHNTGWKVLINGYWIFYIELQAKEVEPT